MSTIKMIRYAICFMFLSTCVCFGSNYYVSILGSDFTGDGSLTKPWRTITHALAMLNGSPTDSHTIFVGPGLYEPQPHSEKFPLHLKSYISLQGSGDSTTILRPTLSEMSRVILGDSTTHVNIDGFAIIYGLDTATFNEDTTEYASYGGGIFINRSSFVSISRNIIAWNEAYGWAAGGGIAVENSSFITVSGNTISHNFADDEMGGGAFGGGISLESSSFILVTKNQILNNNTCTDGSGGGGIFLLKVSHCLISHNVIKGNQAYALFGATGGGIECDASEATLMNNLIDGNEANYGGGGILCEAPTIVLRNIIRNNIAGGGYGVFSSIGGGIYCSGNTTIGGSVGNGNNIINNLAVNSSDIEGFGNQLAQDGKKLINATFNYFGNINLLDEKEIYGNFNIKPSMSSPIVFDTSNLVVLPSPIDFDTIDPGQIKNLKVTMFNVISSLSDSIKVITMTNRHSVFTLSEYSFVIQPASHHSITATFLADSTGIFDDTLIVKTNIGEFVTLLHGIVKDTVTSVNTKDPLLSRSYVLYQNYPNPFNPITELKYGLPEGARVIFKIYDVLGREVATMVDGYQDAGYKTVSFDASNLPSGVYFYKLQAGSFTQVRKMLLLK